MNHHPQAWGRVSNLPIQLQSSPSNKTIATRRCIWCLRLLTSPNLRSKPAYAITSCNRHIGHRREIQRRCGHRRRQPRYIAIDTPILFCLSQDKLLITLLYSIVWFSCSIHRCESPPPLQLPSHRRLWRRRLGHAIPRPTSQLPRHS